MSEKFAFADQISAINKKLGDHEMTLRFLLGELSVPGPIRSWREKNGIIYFSVTSDGTTGEDWITRLKSKGFLTRDSTKEILRSPDFKPTSGVTTEVAVLKGTLFKDKNRITEKIRAKAYYKHKFLKPNAELACLIREKFTTNKEIKAMGLQLIATMHEPINDSDGYSNLLYTSGVYGDYSFDVHRDGPDGVKWNRGDAFAFAVSQISSQP